jgi:predicted RNase H-like HicB family nuclease
MKNESYIGLFRALPRGKWRVSFPDLPGCEVRGNSFREVFEGSRRALSEHLADLDPPYPRPRSSAELFIDAQRDWHLCQQFVDAVLHPVEPAELDEELAPLELVAAQAGGGGGRPPHIGS